MLKFSLVLKDGKEQHVRCSGGRVPPRWFGEDKKLSLVDPSVTVSMRPVNGHNQRQYVYRMRRHSNSSPLQTIKTQRNCIFLLI